MLRPHRPLILKDGEVVQLTVSPPPPRPSDAEIVALIKAAKTVEEVFAIMNAYDTAPPGYDFCEALNANRVRDGADPVFPPEEKGKTW